MSRPLISTSIYRLAFRKNDPSGQPALQNPSYWKANASSSVPILLPKVEDYID